MPIGQQLKNNLEKSNVLKKKQQQYNYHLKKFQENSREIEYREYQKELEKMMKK